MRCSYLFLISLLSACRPSPFNVTSINSRPPYVVLESKKSSDWDAVKKASLKQRYNRLKNPSFALIKGYYRLPNSSPFGSITVVKGISYASEIEAIKINKRQEDYAIEPLQGDEAMALQKGLNVLFSIGVHIKEISLTDALALAKAEREANNTKRVNFLGEHLSPGVDYLISINQSSSELGPVLLGRVVSRDGRLLAFKIIYSGNSFNDISSLILALFEETIDHLEIR